jgi:hypothetical protein
MIVDADTNTVVAGGHPNAFTLSLKDVADSASFDPVPKHLCDELALLVEGPRRVVTLLDVSATEPRRKVVCGVL